MAQGPAIPLCCASAACLGLMLRRCAPSSKHPTLANTPYLLYPLAVSSFHWCVLGGSVQALVYTTVCAQMADDVARGQSPMLIVTGPPQSGKKFSLVGKLGEFVGMGISGRLAADILERIEHAAGAEGALSCRMGIYQVDSEREYAVLKALQHDLGTDVLDQQVMSHGRVRDLLSLPPERRGLVEERIPNNRRRMAVESLTRERVQVRKQ